MRQIKQEYKNNGRQGNTKKKKPFYASMQLIRQIRHRLPKGIKKIFDVESDLKLRDKDISEKAKVCGFTVKQYEEGLQRLRKLATARLALLLNLFEQDSLDNSFDRLVETEKWIREKKDYRAMLYLEKERRSILKKLIDAGRILIPYSEKDDEAETRPKPLPDLKRWGKI